MKRIQIVINTSLCMHYVTLRCRTIFMHYISIDISINRSCPRIMKKHISHKQLIFANNIFIIKSYLILLKKFFSIQT